MWPAAPLRASGADDVEPETRPSTELGAPFQFHDNSAARMISRARDLGSNVCKPGLTINAVELECVDKREHVRGDAVVSG
jgi:hypothetical protein